MKISNFKFLVEQMVDEILAEQLSNVPQTAGKNPPRIPQTANQDPSEPLVPQINQHAAAQARKRQFKQNTDPENQNFNPDTEEGRVNLSRDLLLSIKDLLTRARILDKQIEAALHVNNRQDYKEQLILMNDGLASLSHHDIPKLVKAYLTTVKNYEKQRGRNLPINIPNK